MVLLAYNAHDLMEKIAILEKYFKDNDLCINLEKTKIVLFRHNRKSLFLPKFFWNNEPIEICDHYMYLGVPFFSDMNYEHVGNHFIQKGKKALGNLTSVFKRAKINTIGTRICLFNSLVKSVTMYCSNIWGVTQLNTIERFHNDFLKQLFWLPRFTPNWFVRLETKCDSIVTSVIKNIVTYCIKIFRKPNTLIKACFDQLKLKHFSNCNKYNWYTDVDNIMRKYCNLGIDDLEVMFNTNTLCIGKIVADINLKLQYEDMNRMNSTTMLPRYGNLQMLPNRNDLNSLKSWSLVRFVVQLRLDIPKLTIAGKTVIFKGMFCYFDKSRESESICDLCTLKTSETFYHVISECPAYVYDRESLLHCTRMTDTEYNHYLNNINFRNVVTLLKFVQKIITIREEWLQTFNNS